MSAIINLLQRLIETIGCWVLWAIQTAFNGLVAALAYVVQNAIDLLPDFATLPDWSGYVDGTILGFAAWFIPIQFIGAWLVTLGGLYLLTRVFVTLTNWAKTR